jgi:hypothetical protein
MKGMCKSRLEKKVKLYQTGRVAKVGEHLHSKPKALSSNSNTKKKIKR